MADILQNSEKYLTLMPRSIYGLGILIMQAVSASTYSVSVTLKLDLENRSMALHGGDFDVNLGGFNG